MPMRLQTEAEVAATAIERFNSQYKDMPCGWRFAQSAGGRTVPETIDLLVASDQTPDEIASILNEGWARPKCDPCGKYVSRVALYKDEWGDASTAICADCAAKALRILGVR